MNKNIFSKIALMAGVALMGISCQTDYFNENYLPGYEAEGDITNTPSMEFTLTADDYAAIAKNSENKAIAEEAGEAAVEALSAISKNKYFASQDEAATYIPAWLAATYPTYDNGSMALITYTMALDIPADVANMKAAAEYTLTEENYMAIWGSEEDYATAVTPKTVNKIKNVLPVADDAREGDYVVVTYNYSAEEPAAEEPETPDQPEAPAYTSVLGTAALNEVVEVKGYISAVSTQGPILTDSTGSVLLYKTIGYEIGDEVTVTGTISAHNKGFQIGTNGLTIEKTGTTTVTYPEPMNITGVVADELLKTRVNDEYAYYAKMTGTVAIDKYYNFILADATTAQGSIYGASDELKAQLSDGMEYTIYGYFTSLSGGKYINMIVTSVEPAASAKALALTVKSEKRYAYFKYNGTGYEAADILTVQPADYRNMGQSYDNFTNPAQDSYLPAFLGETYPYAQVDDKVYVGYICRANSVNSWTVDEYVFKGEWVKTIYFGEKQDQFRKAEGVWNVDRTLELDYTNTSSADTKAFYQYCVNWVYDFKDVPMGAPERDNAGDILSTDIVTIDGAKPAGNYWVSNYGNNEFYTGSSAYYGNVDWRPSAVKSGFAAAGMGDLSDDEILAKLKENTAEVYAAVLGYMYPEMTSDEYKKVVIKVYCYGPNKNYSFTFAVADKGVFEYVADSLTEL
ncbi:MAG: hypothetical protein J6V26_00845 [Alistipes sp.]|nr:hypothetical protein [Alistipes sp.]